jgi:hypothetical protein
MDPIPETRSPVLLARTQGAICCEPPQIHWTSGLFRFLQGRCQGSMNELDASSRLGAAK